MPAQRSEPVGPCRCRPLESPLAWVNGVRITPITPDQTEGRVAEQIECGATHVLNPIAAYPTVVARREPAFRDALNRGDLNVPDGVGVMWACRSQGFRRTPRVYGPDLMLRTVTWGQGRGLTHSFVGGTPQILETLIAKLRAAAPQLAVAGTHAPPYRGVSPEGVAEDLAHLPGRADFLWIGLGSPKQQWWADLARQHDPARVIVTVGAAFDFITGSKPQAPKWVQRASLEWLFRLAMEPRRLWRRELVDNASFVWGVGSDLLRERRMAQTKSG
jgi:N-acetylglucosaminyldiphosphoundecaprenol N-acetyl-beta-D-mannosaminyltransferase